MGDDRKIAMNFFNEVGEFVRGVEAGKIWAAGGIESFAEGDAFFQKLYRFAAFAEVLLARGHDVERGGAVGKIGEKFLDGGDVRAGFGGVGGLRGSAANFVRSGLLREDRQGKHRSGDGCTEEATPGEDFHHSDFRREGKDVASSRMEIVWVHPGILCKECGSCWKDGRCILLFAKRGKSEARVRQEWRAAPSAESCSSHVG